MSAPVWIDFSDTRFALVAPAPDVECEFCGRKIGENARRYRTRRWGPDRETTIYVHQKCLLGKLDPTVWDIR